MPEKKSKKTPVSSNNNPNYVRHLKEAKKLVPWWKDLQLKPKEVQFVAEYISNGCNAAGAYRACHTTKNVFTASQRGNLYLKSTKIKEAIRVFVNLYLEERKADLDKRIVDVLTQQAFYDPADFITPKGQPIFKTWSEIPPEKRVCVVGADTRCYGKDADKEITTIRLVDRHQAIKALTDFIQLGRPTQVEISGKGGGAIKTSGLNVNADASDGLKKMSDGDLVNLLNQFK